MLWRLRLWAEYRDPPAEELVCRCPAGGLAGDSRILSRRPPGYPPRYDRCVLERVDLLPARCRRRIEMSRLPLNQRASHPVICKRTRAQSITASRLPVRVGLAL